MIHPLTTIERAFDLARSGEVSSLPDIERKLNAERYADVAATLQGPTLRRDLRQLCMQARLGRRSFKA